MQNVFVWIIGKNKKNYSVSKWKHVDNTEFVKNYIRLQIENSIEMGWDINDIIPITNFPLEHMGVKCYQAESFCDWSSFANKLVVVNEMIQKGVITDNIWLHDCDCYQLVPFDFPAECKDWGYTRHDPKRDKNQGASGFFRKEGYDIVKKIAEEIQICRAPREELFLPIFYTPMKTHKREAREQYVSVNEHLTDHKFLMKKRSLDNYGIFADRFSFLDYTYNLGIVKYFKRKYKHATKPIKALHFHIELDIPKKCFLFGENVYNIKVVTDKLEHLLKKYKFI